MKYGNETLSQLLSCSPHRPAVETGGQTSLVLFASTPPRRRRRSDVSRRLLSLHSNSPRASSKQQTATNERTPPPDGPHTRRRTPPALRLAMADDLDSLVKGAPLSGPGSLGYKAAAALGLGGPGSGSPDGDPLSHTPGSPAMIYLNLLILEASLRAQYLALRARRRHHTFFLILLSGWILGFGYALFLAPREDGSGVGGSVYWVVDVAEKVCFMGGAITAVLIWATGIWDRGVRWPRRWFNVSNRGLRHINCKLVLMKRSWLAETLSTLAWFLTYGLLSNGAGVSSYRYVEPAILREVDRELHLSATGHPSVSPSPGRTASGTNTIPAIIVRDEEKGSSSSSRAAAATQHATHGHGHGHGHSHSHPGMQHLHAHQEDLAPGGDYVKLLLLAKPFSPTFRENWELYRQEYWERENERRALIRRKLKEQDRALRYNSGSWFWWLPGRPAVTSSEQQRPYTPRGRGGDMGGSSGGSGDKNAHHQLHHPRHVAVEREHRRTRSNSSRRGSMSTGSRSGTPAVEVEDTAAAAAVGRKESTGSCTSDRRRKKSSVSTAPAMTRTISAAARRPNASDSRSVTPEIPSPLARENSMSAAG
ncbi:spo7-like protein [Grosmannia clavigera kw1407]|uniref:Spo7-like protein n=1 Tax=Grosmannia clavigera (strain kw1407 / UAMH 11150) TaxID=655863 RepID=F0XGV4_GROCL|nr:spo7-like protein [Grosmannia clavigera kw1407]EFX03162.1 spo7-like protein [Grosmannia clavigera kw1407]